MTSSKLEIHTKGCCLMCLTSCQKSDQGGGGQLSSGGGEGEGGQLEAFNLLLRYLKIDILKLCRVTDEEDEGGSGNGEDVVVTLCDKCASVAKEFWLLYQDLENIQKYLNGCVKSVHDLIKDSQSAGGRVREYKKKMRTGKQEDTVNFNIAERLRKATMKECITKCGDGDNQVDSVSDTGTNPSSVSSAGGDIDVIFDSGNITPTMEVYSDSSSNKLCIIEDDPLRADSGGTSTTTVEEIYGNSLPTYVILATTTNTTDATPAKRMRTMEPKPSSVPSVSSLTCNYCSLTLRDSVNLRLHLVRMHTMEMFSAQLPPGTGQLEMEDAIKTVVQDHLSNYGDRKEGPFVCASCNKSMGRRSFIRSHILDRHIDEVAAYLRSKNLEKSFADVEMEPVVLSIPETSTSGGASSILHAYLTTTSNDEGEPQNNFQILSTASLAPTEEVNLVSPSPSPPPPDDDSSLPPNCCSKCGRRFHYFHLYERHMKQHYCDEEMLKCEYCDNEFKMKKHLRAHMMLLHPFPFFKDQLSPGTTEESLDAAINQILSECNQASDKEYECVQCKKTFNNMYMLRRHVFQMHFEAVQSYIKPKRTTIVQEPEEVDEEMIIVKKEVRRRY